MPDTLRSTAAQAEANLHAVLHLVAASSSPPRTRRPGQAGRRNDPAALAILGCHHPARRVQPGRRDQRPACRERPNLGQDPPQAVATALAGCPRGELIAIDDLFATMRRKRETSPTVARSERALWKLYLVDPSTAASATADFADWPILEGRYTLAVLFEYAATLGLIDIDYTDPVGARTDYHDNWGSDDLDYLSRYDGLSAIRLNPLGAHALGLSQLNQAGADVRGEILYKDGKEEKKSVDGFVVYPDQVILVEVKSLRPALDKRLDPVSYAARCRSIGRMQGRGRLER